MGQGKRMACHSWERQGGPQWHTGWGTIPPLSHMACISLKIPPPQTYWAVSNVPSTWPTTSECCVNTACALGQSFSLSPWVVSVLQGYVRSAHFQSLSWLLYRFFVEGSFLVDCSGSAFSEFLYVEYSLSFALYLKVTCIGSKILSLLFEHLNYITSIFFWHKALLMQVWW